MQRTEYMNRGLHMTVKFYENKADARRLDKTNYLIEKEQFKGVIFKDDTSITNPTIEFFGNDDFIARLNECNYCYIVQLKNYYFIENIEAILGNGARVKLKNDVLMSNKDEIKTLECVIARQENKFNTYLNDDEYKIFSYPRIQLKKFATGFSNALKFILTIGGGR